MKLKELHLTNFRSFKGKHCFVFPVGPGLYFMTGDNRVEPRLEANGTGKTSVWEAIYWLLFDKTSKGLRAGDVSNWDVGSGTVVELVYEHDGLDWIVVRCWSPNSWTLYSPDGTTYNLTDGDDANILQSHLGIEFETFQHSCIMAQGSDMFLDLSIPEKEAVFAKALNLDQWLEYSAKAGTQANDMSERIRRGSEALAELKGQLRENSTQDFSADIIDWNEARERDIAELDRAHEVQAKSLKDLKDEYRETATSRTSLDARIKASRMRREVLASNLSTKNRECNVKADEVAELTADIRNVETQHGHLKDESCPHCLQQINTAHKIRITAQLESQYATLQKVLKNLNTLFSKLSTEASEIEEALHTLDTDIGNMNAQYRELDRDVADYERKSAQMGRDLVSLEAKVVRLRSASNPFEVRQLQQQSRGESLAIEIDELQQTLDDKSDTLRRLQYWVRGFKEIRLYLIAQSVHHLELEVNSSLTQLGLMDWKLQFDVDRENKSGKVRKGFSVNVISPHNKNPVPWKAWSGGESQRLRLAAEMGLSNLIRTSRNVDFPLECWDEPTQFLSGQGVTDLLDSLAARAVAQQRQIWVVDHRSLGYGEFAGTVTVVKDSKGSSIQ